MRLPVLSLLGSLSILAACGGMTPSSAPTSAPSEFCAIARPITWSRKDTDQTILAIKEYDAVGVKLCGWR